MGVLGLVYWGWNSQASKTTKTLQSATVKRGEMIQRSTISGVVTPLRKTIVTAPYQGYIREIFVKLGQDVERGDPIASVSQTLLSSEPVFPLRVPFKGKVVQVNKADGEFVKASDSTDFIVRIDDLSQLFVDSNVPELDRVKMKIGLDAEVRASAILDRTYKAVVRDLSLAAREVDRWGRSTAVEFPMRLEILDFDERLQPGMSVIVDIVTLKKTDVVILRHEFIARDRDQYFVHLMSGKRRNIEVGSQNEEYAEIISGLQEGEKIRKVDFMSLQ